VRLKAIARPETALSRAGLILIDAETEAKIAHLHVSGFGYTTLTGEEMEELTAGISWLLDTGNLTLKDREGGWREATVPSYVQKEVGPVRIPAQVKLDEHGTIIVPPRQKNETPEERRVRRAARRAKRKMEAAKAAGR
jgi:hypothetical protein